MYVCIKEWLYVCMYVVKCSSLTFRSRPSSTFHNHVQNLAMSKALVLAMNKTLKFNSFTFVFQEQFESLEPSRPHVNFLSSNKAKRIVQRVDDQRRLDLIKACVVQGSTLRLQVDDDTPNKTVLSFKDRILSFCLTFCLSFCLCVGRNLILLTVYLTALSNPSTCAQQLRDGFKEWEIHMASQFCA